MKRVVVSVQGGVAEVDYKPDDVEVLIVDFDDLREEANTDWSIRRLGILSNVVGSLHRYRNVTEEDLDNIEYLMKRIRRGEA